MKIKSALGDKPRTVMLSGRSIPWHRLVVGVNPLVLAWKARLLEKLYFSPGEDRPELADLAKKMHGAAVISVSRDEFEKAGLPDGHQNCAGIVAELPNPDVTDVVPGSGPSLVVLLAGITDPHNAGAIIRTAAAAGASAVVLPSHRTVEPGPVLYKASAGYAFRIPVCRGRNLGQVMAELAKADFWSVGSSCGDGASNLRGFKFPERTILVLGSEGKGVPEKLLEKCDYKVKIPMAEDVESLNVSAAAAVLSYAWFGGRG